MPRFESPSRWTPGLVRQHIDKVLLTDQCVKLSKEMGKKRYKANASAKSDYQRLDAWVVLAEEWAEKMFSAYIEIWDLQGFPRCDALYTAVGEAILQGFGGHSSAFEGQLRRMAMVSRRPIDSSTLNAFKARMNALSGDWKRRVDVESRKARYAAQREGAMVLPRNATRTVVFPRSAVQQVYGPRSLTGNRLAAPPPTRKESLRRAVLAAKKDATFKTAEAAIVLEISTRTVSRWAKDGLLKQWPKRGWITAESIQRKLRELSESG